MFKPFSTDKVNTVFFYLCIAVNVIAIVCSVSNPTLDGPSHLYNARVADYIISGNSFIKNYYAFNSVPIPNLTDHYLFTIFCGFLSFAQAEKLMQVIYIISFSVLFRQLVRQFNPGNIGLTVFAIPFSLSFLYYLGFYNFSLSFPILFGVVIYYKKKLSDITMAPTIWPYVVLSLLTLLLYFTNGLAFLFVGFILFVYELANLLPAFKKKIIVPNKTVLLRVSAFILVWLPGILCFAVFLKMVPVKSGTGAQSFSELLKWLTDVRPLIVYGQTESKYTSWLFYCIVLALGVAMYYRVKAKELFKFNNYDIFFLAFLLALALYFKIPDEASVGMMSARLCYFVFVFLLLWLAMQRSSGILTWVVSVAAISVHFLLLFSVHMPVQVALNKEAVIIKQAAASIPANNIVLDVNVNDNWLCEHFGDYLGEDKPLVIVPNYEPYYGWFGITWYTQMPMITFSELKYLEIPAGDENKATKEIDYVCVHGNFATFQNAGEWLGFREVVRKKYTLTYASPDNGVHIYHLHQ